ncbi:hypothetical protein MSG28_004210, partial [Choristoneura fumiferana]
ITFRVPTANNNITYNTHSMTKLVLLMTVAVAAVHGGRLDHLTGGAYGGEATRFENVNNGDGNYRFSGSPRAQGPEGPAVTAEGAFSYRAPDGQQISVSYTADENGFHPVGSHLPTPPPIPDAILNDDGSYNGRNSYRF